MSAHALTTVSTSVFGLHSKTDANRLTDNIKLCEYPSTEVLLLKAAVILKIALKDKTVFDCNAIISS